MGCLYVIDIDATLANASERIKRAGKEPPRSNKDASRAWLSQMMKEEELSTDVKVKGMTALVNSLAFGQQGKVIFLTGREERWRKVTQAWLQREGFRHGTLLMRPNDNWDETHELKERIISQWQCSCQMDEVVVIDDDESGELEKVCDKQGWTFLKARSGGAIK